MKNPLLYSAKNTPNFFWHGNGDWRDLRDWREAGVRSYEDAGTALWLSG